MKHLHLSFLLLCLVATITSKAQQPALLPLPVSVDYGNSSVQVPVECGVTLSNDSLLPSIQHIKALLEPHGIEVKQSPKGFVNIEIVPQSQLLPHKEAYQLQVGEGGISVKAGTRHGIFNALTTLSQLSLGNGAFASAKVNDAPAFSWRGYMVDVGRNYQSLPLLKEQIDAMAKLKLNLFHFHLTENVAWRLGLRSHPELVAPKSMTRDHGLFYSEADIKELIRYCEERHITFLMEIDMPGHSEAFTRATGHNMQSPEGLAIVLEILDEVTTTYNFKYFHIGADEVKITNPEFIPTVTRFLEERGITVIGWQPGGNYPATVWRQLWSEENIAHSEKLGAIHIDSRNLYINHMDALECVPLIFNHQVCDVDKETPQKKGATLCLWNDRRLRRGEDNLTHNPVYPALFAFAEKMWRGGGKAGSYVGIDARTEPLAALRNLEQRMMEVHTKLHPTLHFPYRPQAEIEWQVYGPYDNSGDLARSFAPEDPALLATLQPDTTLIGGTIIWRHFWSPTVKGHYTEVPSNSTFYAHRHVWSEQEQTVNMWLGFYDFSRSTATSTPALGTWNNLESQVWINGEEVAPPQWLRAGQKGNNEYPYEDENYIMRPPHQVKLNAGWNSILVKCPIGSFSSGIWYAPYKWMFTAIILE